ncbi:MAG TPA: PAS domain S-box protein [Nocardioidaceae bacterium]|nr:PAS domain S-box protein [Nocardioidaceae bacterium]
MSGPQTSVRDRYGSVERRLPPHASSVGEARRLVHDLLVDGGRGDLAETAVLLVSEVVTNALLHAGTPIDVFASLDGSGLRVEIGDGSAHLPTRRSYGTAAGTGRGMQMLEHLVDDWGISRSRDGKSIWFRLSRAEAEQEMVSPSTSGHGDPGSDSIVVLLRDVPLLLHAAWQEHAEALLREYLLASLDAESDVGDGSDPIQMHAEATDAIAIAELAIPRVFWEGAAGGDTGDTGDAGGAGGDDTMVLESGRLMMEATEPRVTAAVIEMGVPLDSVPHFAVLDRALQAAVTMSNDGSGLAPPTQPEIQQFRHWLCRQVLSQAEGAEPEPWTGGGGMPSGTAYPLDWDPAPVAASRRALIAADEANRIRAVSAPLLAMLGYDEPGELLGNRVVSIIPERYRQAHVAGFTLYQLVGRAPLLGRSVEVPALRRDGAEITVRMTVHVEPAGGERSVFVAEFAPLS